jgi:Ferritin-like
MAGRDRLIHLLTEAAEIEHNLLCSYLYAALSLKRGAEDGLSPAEATTVARWRKTVLGVAIEEMAHLALVNNLLVALGGAPHFDRPNLPLPPGYHPAGFVIRLMPLNKATLDHFIFLERPADADVPDGAGKYATRAPVEREPTPGNLSPSTPDYETIGEFYDEIRSSLLACAGSAGTNELIAQPERQLSPEMAKLPGLQIVHTIEDALAAVDTIVEQGEGSSCGKANCHFSRFRAMRKEWSVLEAANPAFIPHLPAAHDPVMRKPAQGLERTWITEPHAARLLDLGNAVYA